VAFGKAMMSDHGAFANLAKYLTTAVGSKADNTRTILNGSFVSSGRSAAPADESRCLLRAAPWPLGQRTNASVTIGVLLLIYAEC
jgi:hypothetical protein